MNGLLGLIRIFLRIEKKVNQIFEVLHLLAVQRDLETLKPVTWLDNQDVMQKLKISESTLKRHRLKGVIRSSRIGGKYYYNDSDIQKLLREGVM